MLRRMGGVEWAGLYGLILLAWASLFMVSVPAELRGLTAEFWQDFCRITPDVSGYVRLVGMWALMAVAMMLPTALPAVTTFGDLARASGGGTSRIWTLVAGFLVVWLGFSVSAAALQLGLYQAGLLSPLGGSLSWALSGGFLVLAGLYQFSGLKDACLRACQAPLAFFMGRWEAGAWRNGLQLGMMCLGCCWALMLLAFVGGVMTLAFMGVATLVMTAEKFPQIGARITRPLGYVLTGGGVALALMPLFLGG